MERIVLIYKELNKNILRRDMNIWEGEVSLNIKIDEEGKQWQFRMLVEIKERFRRGRTISGRYGEDKAYSFINLAFSCFKIFILASTVLIKLKLNSM